MNANASYQTHVEQIQTRWGEVRHMRERLDDTYTRHTYQGPREAVIVLVGHALEATTQCYEFMFRLESLTPAGSNGIVEAVCRESNYAGD